MSEFFNQTMKAVPSTLDLEGSTIAGLQEILGVPKTSGPAGPSLGEARLNRCRKCPGVLTDQFNALFGNSAEAQPAEESYRALRTRLLRLQSAKGLRSVVVTSAVPGEGKTLTSLNLALCCSQLQDLRVLLIDADVRTRGLSRAMGFLADAGLVDVITGKCQPDEANNDTEIPNLYIHGLGSITTQPSELFAGQ